ncbi:lipopolysaccharide biosynthesis protein [Uliginosibacterium gangwonense]|uniref:lipopolysaccharide biosynthesis protein n=1 Tax=Uliginosibacterium gangwonense TaxID=392736 RepID=UPI00037E34C2|nr:lipopolysaccharide biosynthesis protein [Uliginosibacterium gangwonense]
MTMKSKLIQNFGANAFGQLVTILIQLVSVPLFLYFWGVSTYGEWLVLSSIPMYLSLSDIGFASVAANDMTMKVAKGDRAGALCSYQSIWVLISMVSILIALLFIAGTEIANVSSLLSIKSIGESKSKYVILILVSYVLIGLQANIFNTAYRAVGHYAYGTLLGNAARLIEWSVSVLVLWCKGDVQTLALSMLACKAATTIVILTLSIKLSPWLKLGFAHARISEIRRLFKPALAFIAFPLGLALALQGMILVIGIVLGSAAVVIYSTYRTLTRFLVQMVTLLNQSAWPEISAAYGEKRMDIVSQLHGKISAITFWMGLLAVTLLSFFGKWIVSVWTHHSFEQNSILLMLMLLAAFTNVLWQTSWVLLMATNQHQKITLAFITATASSLLLSYLIMPLVGLNGVGLVMILCELPMLYITVGHALNMLNETWPKYLSELVSDRSFWTKPLWMSR